MSLWISQCDSTIPQLIRLGSIETWSPSMINVSNGSVLSSVSEVVQINHKLFIISHLETSCVWNCIDKPVSKSCSGLTENMPGITMSIEKHSNKVPIAYNNDFNIMYDISLLLFTLAGVTTSCCSRFHFVIPITLLVRSDGSDKLVKVIRRVLESNKR